jgi:uncharacterized Zn-binding protein involved in type VI secretion
MAALIARIGDPGSHGGSIATFYQAVWCEGPKAAGVGDIYACPIHGPNPIITGSPTSIFEGRFCAHHGSMTACGATIIADSTKSYVNGG